MEAIYIYDQLSGDFFKMLKMNTETGSEIAYVHDDDW